MLRRLEVAIVGLLIVGCGAAVESKRLADRAPAAEAAYVDEKSTAEEPAVNQPEALPSLQESEHPQAERKIIYTATIALVVEDFAAVDQKITQLVRQANGYVAEFREERTFGERLAGRWVVRIPVDQFDGFLEETVKLGVPETRQVNAQDVTEEFVDLEARLANKRRLEERILGLLDDRTGKIKDVIEVESELGRIREDIERMQGRLRFLANRTSMTTVTISAREERDYKPPQAPSFLSRISTAWGNSISGVIKAGENLIVAAVAVTPWLVANLAFILVFALPLCWWWRARRRAKKADHPIDTSLFAK